ncbi:hypothetical protein Ahy_A06g025992 [Arachis hypogaea]|uniref:Ubiquitin-like protease family profile domain-containing protein n=1 Tax=Arachis hypogaea TaxID=3818 RepID=A0A445CJ64_ARAHY|nr:hypothetical protein Ahy_A06g025992 [Arachis hypogaea]
MDGDDMHCLDLLFRPTKEIKFFDKELTIAAYIFGNNLDTEEVLVPNDHCSGTCKTLLTIMPRKPIIGDNCVGTKKYIKDNFMGDLASLHQIFVPVYLNDHWFLIVVDLFHETVRYLDSFKKGTLMTERKSVINNLLNYLENFLSDKNFGETPSFRNIQFSKNDCGIWVAQWMHLNCFWSLDNKTWVVNDFTRMRLAMDLVNDFNNSKRDIIVELSVIDWNKKMQQFVMQT